jgi:hypothetical protein
MKILHGVSIFLIFGMILGLIGLPPIMSSSSLSKTLNSYQSIYAQTATAASAAQGQQRPNILLALAI